MSIKLSLFAAALIVAAPVLAAGAAGSGSSSSASAGSAGSHYAGGGTSGGSGGGVHMGGGASGASAALGGRGAAASTRGAAMGSHGTTLASHGATRIGAMRAADAAAGKHAAVEHATSRLVGTDHHRHPPFRREPHFRSAIPLEVCNRVREPYPLQTWSDCNLPTKSSAGSKQRS